ncbi:hypothetical protein ACGFYY_10440 [Streptomyces sp. NPDC048331]|uniref:hypothetical protein n=1 Tax=Streptomyces sp. NPDC048331 TaxID=3365534 RepID=UPI0037121B06
MDVFTCAGCGTELTVPVSRVALPVHTHYGAWEQLHPPLMDPTTYAVEPEPWGPPWRLWDEVGEAEAAARGVYAPEYSVSFAARGRIVIAPGDSRGMALLLDRCEGYCMGVDGRDGPNLACTGCGRPVATRMDDCGLWQAVWLEPDAVERHPCDVPAAPPPDWDDLLREAYAVPPFELDGSWSRRWAAAVGVALAHLVAACDGGPVTLPGGLTEEVFGPSVARFPAPGLPPRYAAFAGPGIGLPRPAADILLVPRHPLTGEPWRPETGTAVVVPLDSGVWAYLALSRAGETSPVPATGRLPEGVLRDDYPELPNPWPLWPDGQAFIRTLARLPAARSPRLRGYFERPGRQI